MLHITGFADLQMRVPCIQAIQRRFMRESKLIKAAKQKNTKTKAAYTGRRNDENEAKKERRFFGTSCA